MLSQKECTIGGEQYVIQQLPSTRGIQVAIVIGHLVAGAADGIGSSTSGVEDTPINIGGVVAGVLRRMDPEQTPAFVKRLVLESVIRPKMDSDAYERTFSGNYDALWELLTQIIAHNNFLDLVKKRLPAIMESLFSDGQEKATKSTPST